MCFILSAITAVGHLGAIVGPWGSINRTRALSRRELACHRLLKSSAPLFLPGRKKTGGREGRSRSLKRKLSVSAETETLAMRAVSPAKRTVDRCQMAAGDDQVCKLVAVRGPNPAAWGVSMADPGVSGEGSSSLKRRNLRCGGRAAHYIARRPSHFSGLWRAALPLARSPLPVHWFVF